MSWIDLFRSRQHCQIIVDAAEGVELRQHVVDTAVRTSVIHQASNTWIKVTQLVSEAVEGVAVQGQRLNSLVQLPSKHPKVVNDVFTRLLSNTAL